ncbi:MAG: hypothetical protein AB1668_03580 [Nanoarchaeota archaeon]
MVRFGAALGGLVMLVSAATASVPEQANAEEPPLDCSAKTYYALKKRTTVPGSTAVERLFNIVKRDAGGAASGEMTGTYSTGGKKKGQYRVMLAVEDYTSEHTLSYEIEFPSEEYLATEMGNLLVEYGVQQLPPAKLPPAKGSVEPRYEFVLRRFESYDSKKRQMYPYYAQEMEAELPKEDKALAALFAEAHARNINDSYFMGVKGSYFPSCNLLRRNDVQAQRDTAGVPQEKIDKALGVEKEEPKKSEEPGRSAGPKKPQSQPKAKK